MNERVFSYDLSAASVQNQADLMGTELFRDHTTQQQRGKINNAARSTIQGGNESSTNFVYQTKKTMTPLNEMAQSNYYYEMTIKKKEARSSMEAAQKILLQ